MNRLLRTLFAVSLLAGSAMPLPGAAADELADRAIEVRLLVRQLNAPQLEQRNAAEQQLLDMGAGVLEQLPPVNDRMPAEVRHRLGRIRQQLQSAGAVAAVASSRVTLQGQELPLADVLQTIEEQTGNRIDTEQQQIEPAVGARTVDVDFDQTPFWQAVDYLLDQSNLNAYFYAGEQALTLVNRVPGQQPYTGRISYAGAFRFEPLRVSAVRTFAHPDNAMLRLELLIAWEPRLRPIVLRQPLDKITATAANGTQFTPPTTQGELNAEVQRGVSAVQLTLPLELPPRSVDQFTSIQGELKALLLGSREAFRFPEIAAARQTSVRHGDVIVTLDGVRQHNKLWQVQVRIAFAAAEGALESHRDWITDNPCYLVDAAGKRYDNLGLNLTMRTNNEVGFAYLFDLPQGPQGLTLVYETPTAIVDLPIKYELKEIKLP